MGLVLTKEITYIEIMNGYGRFEPMDPNEVTQSAVGTFFLCFFLFIVVSPSHWKAIQRNQLSNEPLTQNQTSSSFMLALRMYPGCEKVYSKVTAKPL